MDCLQRRRGRHFLNWGCYNVENKGHHPRIKNLRIAGKASQFKAIVDFKAIFWQLIV